MLTPRLVRIGLIPVLVLGVTGCGQSVSPSSGTPSPSALAGNSTPEPAPATSTEAPVPGGMLAFLRDGELFVRDLGSGTETSVGTTNQTPLAFTVDGTKDRKSVV